MGRLKANKHDEALKELEGAKVTQELIGKLNLGVEKKNRKFYHVALVRRVHNLAAEDYSVGVVIQIYNKRGFENLKKNVKAMPISKVVVLHDPTLEKDDEKVDTLPSYKEDQIKEKVKQELEEKHKKEMADAVAKAREEALKEANADKNTLQNELGDFNPTTAEYNELVKFCAEKKIDLTGLQNKKQETLVKAVLDWAKTTQE